MRNKLKLIITRAFFIVAAIGLLSTAAHASSRQDVLRSIRVVGTQYAQIEFSGSWAGRPACHAAFMPGHFAFDISTAKGRALLATAQAALLAGKEVTAIGGTTCTSSGGGYGNIETLTELTLHAE